MTDELVAPVGDPEPAQETGGVKVTTPFPKGDTSYVLLSRLTPAAAEWVREGVVEARDPEAAIRSWVENGGDEEGTYVAIAQKFWKPVTPAVEVVTTKTITLKAAS